MIALAGHTATVRGVAYSPDGRRLASGAEDGSVRVWDPAGSFAMAWNSLGASVESLAFIPTGEMILAGLADGKLVALPHQGEPIAWERFAHRDGVRVILPHPDGTLVLTTGWDRELCLWSLANPERTRLGGIQAEIPTAAALSRDGSRLAFSLAGNYKIRLFEADRGPLPDSLTSDLGTVISLAFSPDGAVLAAGDTAGRVLLWELAEPRRPRILEGHGWNVNGLVFTPDGRRLVTISTDRTARVWDVPTGRALQVYEWHRSWLTCLAMAPDGLTVATGGDDHIVALWDLPD